MNERVTPPMPAQAQFKTSRLEEADGPGLNPTENPTMGEIIARRFSRRSFLQGSMAATAIAATVSPMAMLASGEAKAQTSGMPFTFDEVAAGVDADHHVAVGYDADVLLRWGDKIFADAPDFDPENQTPEAQARQFGYNNDFVGYIPIDGSSEHGYLVVNHEYTNEHLMFPGIVTVKGAPVADQGEATDDELAEGGEDTSIDRALTPSEDLELVIAPADRTRVDIEMAAHGGTIIEIRKEGGKWRPVLDGANNRRIMSTTEMQMAGPAAGSDRLKTNADPSGRKIFGTLNNCAGGVTPWGTYIMAEENFHGYFIGELPEGHRETANYERYGVPDGSYE